MTQAFGKRFFQLVTLVAVSACSDYEVKFNERPIYTPEPLFTDYRLSDDALYDCVKQTIVDRRITAAEDLVQLVCTNAGITSLEGLSTFRNLQRLNLADNEITEIEPLSRLPELQRVDLSSNALEKVQALKTLAKLERLDVTGNPALDCHQMAELEIALEITVEKPEHCSSQDR